MKILTYNEFLNEKFEYENVTPNSYFFSSDNFRYTVVFADYDINSYFVAFKAKKDGEYLYDFDVITNDNLYKVMKTISDIVKRFIENRNKEVEEFMGDKADQFYVKRLLFTLESKDDKKNRQRLNLYKRVFSDIGDISYDKEENRYTINIINPG